MKCIELNRGMVAIVDDEDFEKLAQYRWHWTPKGAARSYCLGGGSYKNRRNVWLKMHRVIMGVTDPKIYVDHINLNPFDNRKQNLRLATHGQNKANSKAQKNNAIGIKGVTQRGSKFRASIAVNRKTIQLGTFATPQEASDKYFQAAQQHFGEFARRN